MKLVKYRRTEKGRAPHFIKDGGYFQTRDEELYGLAENGVDVGDAVEVSCEDFIEHVKAMPVEDIITIEEKEEMATTWLRKKGLK